MIYCRYSCESTWPMGALMQRSAEESMLVASLLMLTMRAMDEHGKWLSKSRKVYDLDENGLFYPEL